MSSLGKFPHISFRASSISSSEISNSQIRAKTPSSCGEVASAKTCAQETPRNPEPLAAFLEARLEAFRELFALFAQRSLLTPFQHQDPRRELFFPTPLRALRVPAALSITPASDARHCSLEWACLPRLRPRERSLSHRPVP